VFFSIARKNFATCLNLVSFQDDQLAFLVDPVLDTEDLNRDGFIDYPEYIATTIKQRAKETKQQRAVPAASWASRDTGTY